MKPKPIALISPLFGWLRHRPRVIAALAVALGLMAFGAGRYHNISKLARVTVLNGLRYDINAHYGYRQGLPRINYGPCGRFARVFRERWNARFREQINIAFVMAPEGFCHHVVLKFSDDSYFDGGHGVMSEAKLRSLYPQGSRIEEMVEFDLSLLDQRVGGLDHDHYRDCPNYSDKLTAKLIENRVALLVSDMADRRGPQN